MEYHGDKKVFSVSIDSFSIERERLGPFSIGPLRIAHLKNVKVDIFFDEIESKLSPYQNPSSAGEGDLRKDEPFHIKEKPIAKSDEAGQRLNLENIIFSIKKNLPKEIKKIRGLKIRNIYFNLWKNEKKIFSISSDTATVDRETGDIIFTGHAIMDAGMKGKLISHRILWIKKTQLFRVTDAYYLIKDGKRTEGKSIEIDYLFKKIKYE